MASPTGTSPVPDELKEIKRRLKALEGRGEGNPFNSVAYVLALEDGSTISTRTRRLGMSSLAPQGGNDQPPELADAATEDVRSFVPVPADWVVGTDITLHITVYKADAGAELAVLRSWIGSQADTETRSFNVESDVDINTTIPASSELEEITRTIAASYLATGDNISWVFRREGGDGADALGESLFIGFLPWIEYTAFF